MAFRQLEFLMRERLRVGLQAFRDDPTLVDRLFEDLSLNSRTNIKDWLQNHEVSIILGFPRNLEDFPCWTLAMAGESPAGIPLGQLFDHEYDSTDGESDNMGDLVNKTYQITTMSQDPDLTLILATMLQHILKSMRQDLDLEGFHRMTVAQQDAVDLRVQFLPNYLYTRTTTFSVLVQDTVLFIDSTLPRSIDIALNVDMTLPGA